MIKKRFGKQMMGCKHIKGTKSYRCSPLHKKKLGGKKAKSGRKGGRGRHLGHKTTRGLAQDQRLKSQEKHEKAYRKQKRAGKR